MTRSLTSALLAVLVLAGAGTAQQSTRAAPRSTAEKIREALTAAPRAITEHATVRDWPASPDQPPPVLREGSNGWTCFPTMPEMKGVAPMCLDESWMQWGQALLEKRDPQLTRTGVAYMIAGGAWSSAKDPDAKQPTPDNDWGYDGPHLMIVVPDLKSLAGLPTDRKNASSGPYVMFAGTPYAHIMVPIAKQ